MNRARGTKLAIFAVLMGLVFAFILMWPVATWLQYRELWIANEMTPDAVYLVAGSPEQDRRINGIVLFLRDKESSLRLKNGDEKGQTNTPLQILIGNDNLTSRWSSEEQRNLKKAEWAMKKLEEKTPVQQLQKDGQVILKIVPGQFNNTDGEMIALGAFLKEQPKIRTLALATSLYHLRRAVWRLREHLDRDIVIVAVKEPPAWHDRLPWVVAGEICKMARDAMGLSHARFVSRSDVCEMQSCRSALVSRRLL